MAIFIPVAVPPVGVFLVGIMGASCGCTLSHHITARPEAGLGIRGISGIVVWLYRRDGPQKEIRRPIGQDVRHWERWVAGGGPVVSIAFEWPSESYAIRLRITSAIASKPVASSSQELGSGVAPVGSNRLSTVWPPPSSTKSVGVEYSEMARGP